MSRPSPAPMELSWPGRATSIDGVERELARIWEVRRATLAAEAAKRSEIDGPDTAHHVAARTSVMNLVTIAGRPEVAERCAAIIAALTVRHPSRTILISPSDPDGPGWFDARLVVQCVPPHADAPETCAEMIHVTAGGETGRHLSAIVEPLIVHDLPVTVWWPGEPPLAERPTADLLEDADRLVVDGSGWSGDGLRRVVELAHIAESGRLAVFDFALVRQSRWREAIASTFDHPTLTPFLGSLTRVDVSIASHDSGEGARGTNVVRPLYHVAWLASRLGLGVSRPLVSSGTGFVAILHRGGVQVPVTLKTVVSSLPAGSTLRIEIVAERRGSRLVVDVSGESQMIRVRAVLDGANVIDRSFLAPRPTEADLLSAAIETPGRDPITHDALLLAARMAEEPNR